MSRVWVWESTHVDTPKFFDGVECDDFLQQIVPVVALCHIVSKLFLVSMSLFLPFR